VLRRFIEPGQFRSRKFQQALTRHHMLGSMGQVGSAGDNAAMESFFSLLQKHVLNRQTWTPASSFALRSSPGSNAPTTTAADGNQRSAA
jgi:putative transposase